MGAEPMERRAEIGFEWARNVAVEMDYIIERLAASGEFLPHFWTD